LSPEFSLHVNSKKIEASSNHPDGDQQFDHIAMQRAAFRATGLPILSTDTDPKKKNATSQGRYFTTSTMLLVPPNRPHLSDGNPLT
jgi:hypothetical protein